MTDLLPCPFCGSVNVDYIGAPGQGYRVQCKGCLAQSGWGDYGYQVLTQWNKRIPDAAQAAPKPVAWMVERECDPTFPRLFDDEAEAMTLAAYITVKPPATIRPLYTSSVPSTEGK